MGCVVSSAIKTDLGGTDVCRIWNLHPGPDVPLVALQIHTSKRAGVELRRPIVDQAVASDTL